MKKPIALFVFLFTLGVSIGASAQTVYMNLSEPRPLAELGIIFAADNYFFANYEASTMVVYVNNREVGTVPARSYRRADNFYVASNTKIEAYISVVTNNGTKRKKMEKQGLEIRKTGDRGWLFYLKK